MDNTFDTALLSLLSSNVQWADQVKAKDPDFFVNSAKAQTPKILWLGCADSRVPESVVTASAPGDIFVHRNIANQFHSDDASALSVLQFAVESVGVQHACYDLAHSQSATPPPILTTHLGRWLSPLVSLAGELGPLEDRSKAVLRLIEKNVKMQVQTICETETIRKAWSNGKNVRVHGWIYALETGILRDLDISQGLERAI
ncbi:carbonic anhydrase [Cantharellus anzutake]|uniref:carbonic anhydrase n=1 Tax=Cantharellus anzutake TaxID=1750568 RepID=UPI00190493D7|nr:carbonic anhydrase [Cantharellus anzutake]KAF8335958.1 carbonic anhydrase [Cantharellus anzutake]